MISDFVNNKIYKKSKMPIDYLFINIIKIIPFLFLLKSVSSKCSVAEFCIESYTLNNGNIMIITFKNISFYDSSLKLLKYSNISETYDILTYLHIDQYSNEFGNYILVLLYDSLLLFDEEGNKLCNKTLGFFGYFKYIVPIEKKMIIYIILLITMKREIL